MVALVKAVLIPGSVAFLLLGLWAGVILLYWGGRSVRFARQWLTALGVLYLVLSLAPVAETLVAGLKGPYGTLAGPSDTRGSRVIVVVGNGAVSYAAGGLSLHQLTRRTSFVVFEAVRLYRLLDPAWIVASGGIADPSSLERPESAVIRDALVTLGVPAERILLEPRSTTTAEQMAGAAALLRAQGIDGPVILVTSAAHIRRVMSSARQQGLNAVASVAGDLEYGPREGRWHRWRPSMDALRGSESAMYEYLALAYYWMRPAGAVGPG